MNPDPQTVPTSVRQRRNHCLSRYIHGRVVDLVKVFPWNSHLHILLAPFPDYERT